MGLRFLVGDVRISSRKFATATLLISGSLAWFFLLHTYLSDVFTSYTADLFWVNLGRILFYGFAVFSAVVGSLIGERFCCRKYLLLWIAFGVVSTIMLAASIGTIFSVFFSVLLGLSLGLGLPSSMAFLAESTAVEERSRVSGTTILGTFVVAFLAIATVRILGLGIVTTILLFAVVRSISFLALALDKIDIEKRETGFRFPKPLYKEFVFYLFPWVLFTIAASLATNLIPENQVYASAVAIGTTLRYVCIAIFGFVSGVIADRIGRKQPIIMGLILLGVSFALLGFAISPNTVIIYLTASGAAWGSFLAIYLAIPGDLSFSGSREKFYAMGTIFPLIILTSFSMIPGTAVLSSFSASSFSQLLSVILFLSIIPVLRAKETLPESIIRERKLKEHVKKLGKIVQESSEPK